MEKRLNEKGIRTMDDLLALDCEQAGQVWGSVWGERLWHWLQGEDFDMAETEHLKSMSHQHVLAPEMRTPEKAWAVAHKLLHKAAMRLRADGLWASSIGLAIGFAVPRGENMPSQQLRRAHAGMESRAAAERVPGQPDAHRGATPSMGIPPVRPGLRAPLLHRRASERAGARPPAHAQPLRRPGRRAEPQARLLAAMDALNNKYGLSTLAPATMLTAFKAAPTRIAFHTIPELF